MFRNVALAALAAVIGGFASYSNASIAYDAVTTNANDGNFFNSIPHFMQVITLDTPDAPQRIDTVNRLGLRYNTDIAADTADLLLSFYSNVDESNASIDAFAGANFLGDALFDVPAGTTGSYFLDNLPIDLLIPGNKIAIAVSVLNDSDETYHLGFGPRVATGTPVIGSNDGFVYLDQNTNGTFAGSERYREIGISAQEEVPTNMRVSLSTTIPEPSAIALLAPMALTLLRRSRVM